VRRDDFPAVLPSLYNNPRSQRYFVRHDSRTF
jgi:hypothetical protein